MNPHPLNETTSEAESSDASRAKERDATTNSNSAVDENPRLMNSVVVKPNSGTRKADRSTNETPGSNKSSFVSSDLPIDPLSTSTRSSKRKSSREQTHKIHANVQSFFGGSTPVDRKYTIQNSLYCIILPFPIGYSASTKFL